MLNLDNQLRRVNLRIICILIMQNQFNQCVYRVYCSDGAFTDYVGYNRLPDSLKLWLSDRNSFDYTIPSAMVVSCVKVA